MVAELVFQRMERRAYMRKRKTDCRNICKFDICVNLIGRTRRIVHIGQAQFIHPHFAINGFPGVF